MVCLLQDSSYRGVEGSAIYRHPQRVTNPRPAGNNGLAVGAAQTPECARSPDSKSYYSIW